MTMSVTTRSIEPAWRAKSVSASLPFAASPSAPQSQRELYDEGDHYIYYKAAQLTILLDAINSRACLPN